MQLWPLSSSYVEWRDAEPLQRRTNRLVLQSGHTSRPAEGKLAHGESIKAVFTQTPHKGILFTARLSRSTTFRPGRPQPSPTRASLGPGITATVEAPHSGWTQRCTKDLLLWLMEPPLDPLCATRFWLFWLGGITIEMFKGEALWGVLFSTTAHRQVVVSFLEEENKWRNWNVTFALSFKQGLEWKYVDKRFLQPW